MPESVPAYITSLIRHFADLRDGTHGGSASRKDKEAHFEKAVQLLAPVARQVLTEMNTSLLLDTGQLTETGLRRTADGGLIASWVLSWHEQQAAGVEPIALQAYFGGGFHHPHLRGTTVHDWPLNVFSDEDAAAQLSILRAIASSDLHNLVYRADYRIVPAVTAHPATPRERQVAPSKDGAPEAAAGTVARSVSCQSTVVDCFLPVDGVEPLVALPEADVRGDAPVQRVRGPGYGRERAASADCRRTDRRHLRPRDHVARAREDGADEHDRREEGRRDTARAILFGLPHDVSQCRRRPVAHAAARGAPGRGRCRNAIAALVHHSADQWPTRSVIGAAARLDGPAGGTHAERHVRIRPQQGTPLC